MISREREKVEARCKQNGIYREKRRLQYAVCVFAYDSWKMCDKSSFFFK